MKIRILKELPDAKVGEVIKVEYDGEFIKGVYSPYYLIEKGFAEIVNEEGDLWDKIKYDKDYNALHDVGSICSIAKAHHIKIVENAIGEWGMGDGRYGSYIQDHIRKCLKESK